MSSSGRTRRLDGLAELRTPFRAGGRVTAGNSAGLTDGATAGLLAAEPIAAELGLEPSMRLVGFAYAGVEPHLMGLGPGARDAARVGPVGSHDRQTSGCSSSTSRSPCRCSHGVTAWASPPTTRG